MKKQVFRVLIVAACILTAAHFIFGVDVWPKAQALAISTAISLVVNHPIASVRWTVNLAKLLPLFVKQMVDIKSYVLPWVGDVILYPDEHRKSSEPQYDPKYIILTLNWSNLMFYPVEIRDIKGEFSIEGSNPPSEFHTDMNAKVNLKPCQQSGNSPIGFQVNVSLDEYSFKRISNIRSKGHGKFGYSLRLSANINGRKVVYGYDKSGAIKLKYTYVS